MMLLGILYVFCMYVLMAFRDLLNLAESLEAPTLNVSSSSLVTLLLNVNFAAACLALFPNR
jgi:hypothetical protein